jgi:hypothetical protein
MHQIVEKYPENSEVKQFKFSTGEQIVAVVSGITKDYTFIEVPVRILEDQIEEQLKVTKWFHEVDLECRIKVYNNHIVSETIPSSPMRAFYLEVANDMYVNYMVSKMEYEEQQQKEEQESLFNTTDTLSDDPSPSSDKLH